MIRREYFLSLIVLSEGGIYTGEQAPVAASIIMGVVVSMIGFCNMFVLPMADFSDLYMSYLPKLHWICLSTPHPTHQAGSPDLLPLLAVY